MELSALRHTRVCAIALRLLLGLSIGVSLLGAATTTFAASAPLKFSSDMNLSKSPQMSLYPTLRTGPDGTMHLVWIEVGQGNGPFEIRYLNSTDQGKTWGSSYTLSTNPSNLSSTMMDVSLAVDGRGQVHVVWSERDKERVLHVYYRRRDAGGVWHDKIAVAETAAGDAGDGYSGTPNIDIATNAAAPDDLHLVWRGSNGKTPKGKWAIYYAESTDGGQNWGGYRAVSETGGYGSLDQARILAEKNGDVHVMWRGAKSGIQATHRINGVWSKVEKVDTYGWSVSMTDAPDGIYAVYQGKSTGGNNRGIRFVHWTPSGAGAAGGSWSNPHSIANDDPATYLARPSITVDAKGTIYVAYDRSYGMNGIAYRTSANGGKNWAGPFAVTGARAQGPQIRYQNGLFTLVYAARIGSADPNGNPGYDIIFRKASGQ